MNDYENGIITGRIGLGVDYYKGEKGDKPVKGVDYFTQEDIDEIAAYIESDGIDLSDYAKKEDVEQAIADIDFPAETDPVFTASAASAITPADISSWNSKSDFSGDYEDLTNKPTIPTKTSELTNDSNFVAQSELNDYATVSYVDQGIVAMKGAIEEVNTNLDTRVPAIPEEDGNYKLTTSISSGTATTGWVEDSGSSGSGFSGDYNDLTNKPTLFSGDYNDLTNKPTIPAAYTLPTATTSTLGGVKVDGETITIADGVISAVGGGSGSGGSSYTASNGIEIDSNNVIKLSSTKFMRATYANNYPYFDIGYNGRLAISNGTLDLANSSPQYSVCIAGSSFNGANRYITNNIILTNGGAYTSWLGGTVGGNAVAVGYDIQFSNNQIVIGRNNIPDANSQFGMIVGNGTANSARSDLYTIGANGIGYFSNDLYVNCSDFTTTSTGLTTANCGGSKVATESYVDQAIANIPSSGTTYTAGNGISIDSNGVISLDLSSAEGVGF